MIEYRKPDPEIPIKIDDNAGDPGAPAFFDWITEANLFQGFVATKAVGSFRSEIGAIPRRNKIF